jgi:hypothetical protein
MIDRVRARAIAQEYVDSMRTAEELVILDDETMEEDFGWVFFYQSAAWVHGGDVVDRLGGNAPVVVRRSSGAVHPTGTALPLEKYLHEFRGTALAPSGSTYYTCPVCGYQGLDVPPYAVWPPPEGVHLAPPYRLVLGRPSYDVCACCGFEFGNDDDPGTVPLGDSFESYRARWIAEGMQWFDPKSAPRGLLGPGSADA